MEKLDDFRNFLIVAWHYLGLPAPTELQLDVAREMQYGHNRLALLCFRGFGKSWITSAFGCWRLYLDANRKFLNTSASRKKSDDATRFMLDLIRLIPQCRHLEPRFDQRRSNSEFDVNGCKPAHAPSVRSLGITSNAIVGSRCDDFCADDVESKENSMTIGMRGRIRDKIKELGGAVIRSSDEVDNPKSIYLGTPQIEDSMYFDMEDADYRVLIYPARYPTDEMMEIYGERLAPIIRNRVHADRSLANKPTEPGRFSHKVLMQREAEYGRTGWLLQFMLLPSLSRLDRYPLKINDLIVVDSDLEFGHERYIWTADREYKITDLPCVGFYRRDWFRGPSKSIGKMIPYQRVVMAVDPAGSGTDETAWVILGVINSQIHLLDVGGYRSNHSDERFRELAYRCRKWNVTKVWVEKNYGGNMWSQLLRPHLRAIHPDCGIEDDSVGSRMRKEQRIVETLDPVVDSHRLVVNRAAIEADYASTQDYGEKSLAFQLMYQLSRVTQEPQCLEHDDRLDALSFGVAHLSDSMSRDYEQEIEYRKEEELDQLLEDWDEYVHGQRRPRRAWVGRIGVHGNPRPSHR